ncbi:hypothetical protein KM043_017385 [Ampulex compressa]|nr:hypothetical protein KM043_017385 [Ampulex compressa]
MFARGASTNRGQRAEIPRALSLLLIALLAPFTGSAQTGEPSSGYGDGADVPTAIRLDAGVDLVQSVDRPAGENHSWRQAELGGPAAQRTIVEFRRLHPFTFDRTSLCRTSRTETLGLLTETLAEERALGECCSMAAIEIEGQGEDPREGRTRGCRNAGKRMSHPRAIPWWMLLFDTNRKSSLRNKASLGWSSRVSKARNEEEEGETLLWS